jgi:hypothetical protein
MDDDDIESGVEDCDRGQAWSRKKREAVSGGGGRARPARFSRMVAETESRESTPAAAWAAVAEAGGETGVALFAVGERCFAVARFA